MRRLSTSSTKELLVRQRRTESGSRLAGFRGGIWSGVLLVALVSCSSAGGPTNTSAPSTGTPLTETTTSPPAIRVTSTLDGQATLPHRIHWIARPTGATSEVDFLVDGRQLWVEHNAPYVYGDDGNYLVTSFLTPGKHVFSVRAIGLGGQTATDSVTATVPVAPAPPEALTGTWKSSQSGHPPGDASLIVNSEGWYIGSFPVTDSNGNRVDVAYLSPGLLEVRTGMATGHDLVSGAASDNDLNGWCNDAPGSPARYRWSVNRSHLHFTFVSGLPCPGFTQFLKATWTRVT
jgi:hypothetical protein